MTKSIASLFAAFFVALSLLAAPAASAEPGKPPPEDRGSSVYTGSSPNRAYLGAKGRYQCSSSASALTKKVTHFGTVYLFRSKRCHTYWSTFVANSRYAKRVAMPGDYADYIVDGDLLAFNTNGYTKRRYFAKSGPVFQSRMQDANHTPWQSASARVVIKHLSTGRLMSVAKTSPVRMW